MCSTARRYCTNPLALPLAGLQREMCSSSRRNCQKFGAVPLHLKSGTARVRLHFRKRGCRSGRAFPLAGMQHFFCISACFLYLRYCTKNITVPHADMQLFRYSPASGYAGLNVQPQLLNGGSKPLHFKRRLPRFLGFWTLTSN